MPITQDTVFEKLKNVIDPELFVNIVDLGLIYEVKIDDTGGADDAGNAAAEPADTSADQDVAAATAGSLPTDISIDMTMTSPACPAGPQLIAGAKKEVGNIEGVRNVEVKIVLDPPWTPDRMTEDAKDQLGIF